MKDSRYWLMDGRANHDVDAAMVLETCDSLEEAYQGWKDYGSDTCIVEVETQTVIDCLLWHKEND